MNLPEFLTRQGLTAGHLEQVLAPMATRQVDLADLFFQRRRLESWSLEDGKVRDAGASQDLGLGVRCNQGELVGFAYTDDLSLPAMLAASKSAAEVIGQGQTQLGAPRAVASPVRFSAASPHNVERAAQVARLRELDAFTRSLDVEVKEVNLSLVAQEEDMLWLGHTGEHATDRRPLVRFGVSVLVQRGDRRERGQAGGGGRFSLDELMTGHRLEDFCREAVRIARVNLESVAAPAGAMPVVLGSGWPGVLLHEAVGHGLEGDFNRKGTSNFSGKIGQQVAAKGVTVIDDATLADRRGSLNVDDEGVPGQRTVLIEDGKLVGYLQDRLNARLMGGQSTGNGRRESYDALTLPRMTNTFMEPGEHSPEEIVESVKDGIYAVNFGGGQVDITSGNFVFSTTEAYRIRNGKIAEPVKGATLIGDGPEVMQRVDMIGNDLALDSGVGTCGKEGQSVPVGVGQPTLRVSKLVVGGEA